VVTDTTTNNSRVAMANSLVVSLAHLELISMPRKSRWRIGTSHNWPSSYYAGLGQQAA
jgi:hypothetical protein